MPSTPPPPNPAFRPLDLTLQRNTPVSLHEQLVTQFSIQIAAGALPAGRRLPSVRKLSKQLGVHYNTCLAAYHELESRGLIRIKQGSGVTVADLPVGQASGAPQDMGLNALCRYFVQQVYRKGYRWEDVQTALQALHLQYACTAVKTVVFADKHPDIMPVFQAELSDALQQPVHTLMIDQMDPRNFPGDTLYLTSRYHIRALREKLPPEAEVLLLDVGGGQQEIEALKKLPAGELVVIASCSAIILQQAEAVVTALRGDELLIRTLHTSVTSPQPEALTEIPLALKYAGLILGDTLTTPMLTGMTRKPVHTLRVVPEAEIRKIREYLAGSAPNPHTS